MVSGPQAAGMMRADDVLAQFRALPVRAVADAVAELGRFAVLSPHPDDESLGCGGLIAAACAGGVPPVVVMLTDGAGSHPGSAAYPPARLAAVRRAETRDAVAVLGVPDGNLHFLDAPDAHAAADGPEAEALAGRFAASAAGCDAILTTWRHDPHCDHAAAWAIARRVAHRLGVPLWEFPVWGWTLPSDAALQRTAWLGWRVDISRHLRAKRVAVAAHASQHGRLIMDSPEAFVLPAAFLALFDGPFETLVRAP